MSRMPIARLWNALQLAGYTLRFPERVPAELPQALQDPLNPLGAMVEWAPGVETYVFVRTDQLPIFHSPWARAEIDGEALSAAQAEARLGALWGEEDLWHQSLEGGAASAEQARSEHPALQRFRIEELGSAPADPALLLARARAKGPRPPAPTGPSAPCLASPSVAPKRYTKVR